MSPEPRPTKIICAGCGNTADARYARQAVLSFPRSACGRGTMTDPIHVFQTNVWFGACCERRLDGPIRQRSRWALLDRIAMTTRQLIAMWLRPPADVKRNLFGEEVHERKVAR